MFQSGALSLLQFLLPLVDSILAQYGVGGKSDGPTLASMPPIRDMHNNAHLKGFLFKKSGILSDPTIPKGV